jgi:hypothetical protein
MSFAKLIVNFLRKQQSVAPIRSPTKKGRGKAQKSAVAGETAENPMLGM